MTGDPVSLDDLGRGILSVEIRLPWPPSLNHYWRSTVVGKRVVVLISEDGRKYRRHVAQLCMVADIMHRMRGSLGVQIDAHPPDNRARDLDNLPKSILDALTHAHVWLDDGQIDDLRIRRCPVVKGGAVVVRIEPLVPR